MEVLTIFKTKYLKELAKNFSSEEEVITEIVNLEAILNLPKGTEYFISDIHREFEGFNHIMKTGAGTIKEKIVDLFLDISSEEQKELSFLVSYPEYIIKLKKEEFSPTELTSWYYSKIRQLIILTQYCSSKYSRLKLRKALPKKYNYIIEELIYVEKNWWII